MPGYLTIISAMCVTLFLTTVVPAAPPPGKGKPPKDGGGGGGNMNERRQWRLFLNYFFEQNSACQLTHFVRISAMWAIFCGIFEENRKKRELIY